MVGMRVSELARRSGVPATTLRFYGQQGLLPAARSGSGYRIYDEAAVDRLGFITTAKRLGLSLPQIAELLRPWEHGVCRDVQSKLAPLIETRLRETRQRVAELQRFAGELDTARAHLATIDRDGPCDRSCSFRNDPFGPPGLRFLPVAGDVGGDARRTGRGSGDADAVIACSLELSQRASRIERWRVVLDAAVGRREITGGLRVEFDPGRVDIAGLAELVAAEARCCAFLEMRLCFEPGPVLEARAPAEAAGVLVELFGEPSTSSVFGGSAS